MIKILLTGAAAIAFTALTASSARADYICQINNPTKVQGSPGGYGIDGGFYFNTYTGKDCSGTFIRSYYACTASPSLSLCTNNAGVQYDRTTLLTLFSALKDAAAANHRLSISLAGCVSGGTTTCFGGVAFMSDG
jgi:hypothetical protein